METKEQIAQEKDSMVFLFKALSQIVLMQSGDNIDDLQTLLIKRVNDLDLDKESKDRALVQLRDTSVEMNDAIHIAIMEQCAIFENDILSDLFHSVESELDDREIEEEAESIKQEREMYYARCM